MIKILARVLAVFMLLTCLVSCKTECPAINPEAVLQHLLTDISYDSALSNVGDMARVYFSGLPQNVAVTLYISESGYIPDEVAMFHVDKESDLSATRAAIQKHLDQLHIQFRNYIPEEIPKIESAVTWESGKTIFLVITSDTRSVNDLFKRAHTFTVAADSTLPATSPAPSNRQETTPSTTAPPPTEATEPTQPIPPAPVIENVPVLTSASGTYSESNYGIVYVDNAAYEPYGYDPYVSGMYIQMVSSVADSLSGMVNVYCMPIPTAISVVLPDDICEIYPRYQDQGAQINEIFSKASGNVTGVNCYDNLMLHRDEYLYFRTDYHWNGPAAYYAYEKFCEARGFTPYTMEERKVTYFDNFLGAFYSPGTQQAPILSAEPDTVLAYHPVSDSVSMFFQDTNGNTYPYPIIQDVSAWDSSSKYLTFAAGDQPYTEFHNPDVPDGTSLILVKESYGNVLPAFLIDHYSTIYEIDYRYWEGDLVQFAMDVSATDILFANNMTMISAGLLVGMLSNIIP